MDAADMPTGGQPSEEGRLASDADGDTSDNVLERPAATAAVLPGHAAAAAAAVPGHAAAAAAALPGHAAAALPLSCTLSLSAGVALAVSATSGHAAAAAPTQLAAPRPTESSLPL